jgi:hypothetical protein
MCYIFETKKEALDIYIEITTTPGDIPRKCLQLEKDLCLAQQGITRVNKTTV